MHRRVRVGLAEATFAGLRDPIECGGNTAAVTSHTLESQGALRIDAAGRTTTSTDSSVNTATAPL